MLIQLFRFNRGSHSNGPGNRICTEILQLILSKAARNKNIAEKRDPDYCLQWARKGVLQVQQQGQGGARAKKKPFKRLIHKAG